MKNEFMILFLLFVHCSFTLGQLSNQGTAQFIKGLNALEQGEFKQAKEYFKESIRNYDDAPSHYQLAKIYLIENTHVLRNEALKHFKKAVWKEPDNIEYRYSYASLLEDFSKFSAIDEYEKILELNEEEADAWLKLAKISGNDFDEFIRSGRLLDGWFFASLDEYAYEDFEKAKYYYEQAIKYDSLNAQAYFDLAMLYENLGEPGNGISVLQSLVSFHPENSDGYLYLGLLYYKTSQIEKSYQSYSKALDLMTWEEKKDFTFESVRELISPAFEEEVTELGYKDLKRFIEYYWNVRDPLLMTDYNERLLEHYSRVAYANLRFSVKDMDVTGWRSDRGDIVLRYGEPLEMVRIRPQMAGNGVRMKTEVWYFENMRLGFTDQYSSGNYVYSVPSTDKSKLHPQFGGDSHWFAEVLKSVRHEEYRPKFEGPLFELPYDIAQFKGMKYKKDTDIYISYGLNLPDSLFGNVPKDYSHDYGIFLLDTRFNKVYEYRDSINTEPDMNFSSINNNEFYCNTNHFTAKPDSGYIALEVIRDIDKGVSANREKFQITDFSKDTILLSDIILATEINTEGTNKNSINRSEINITANPTGIFTTDTDLFIYYEIYNLEFGENHLTDFEQNISLSLYENPDESLSVGKIVGSVLQFIGIGEEDKITISSNYQTQERDSEIFLQIDMSGYEPGDYLLTLEVKDNISGCSAITNKVIYWQ